MSEPHVVSVESHETPLGTRWKWVCTCHRGAFGYTSEDAAMEYGSEHPGKMAVREAMWARHRG